MVYTVKELADFAGVSVRTLHHYDQIGLLPPRSRSAAGYRQYGDAAAARLQQIMFFRELGFGLEEIRGIVSQPDYDALEAMQSHRRVLSGKASRINELLVTLDKTIGKLKGETSMEIEEFYHGFSQERIKQYREEVRQRWGDDALQVSESRVKAMGKEGFAALQAEGDAIFRAMADNMPKGAGSAEVQAGVAEWRRWLANFYSYSDEAVLGLGQMYSRDVRFAAFFRKFHQELPEFFTKAVEYYFASGV